MNKLSLGVSCAAMAISSLALADVAPLLGSTTLSAVIADALTQSGLAAQLSYQGGGSGEGEKALVEGKQGIAPMSRAFKPEALAKATAAGIKVVDHVIALDGVALFVNDANQTPQLTFEQLGAIFGCTVTQWQDVPGSNLSGHINVIVRDAESGTTDTLKSLAGIKAFGPCVSVVAQSDDVASATASDANAIGYAGLGGKREHNREVALSKAAGTAAVLPNTATIRNFSYPLSRALHVYEATGARQASAAELQLLEKLNDRSFIDPIVQDHDFVTID